MNASLPPLQPGATAELAEFASSLAFDSIPEMVIERVRMCLLDGIGVCLHGSTLPWSRMVQDMVLSEGGPPEASLFGAGRKASWSQAVLANATAGHAFEMDDIHTESVLHPNSITTPIALGFAEAREGATMDLLTAIVAGCEIGIRVGNAATTRLFLNGFHPQGTTGAFVAAATAGRLCGLDALAMQNAIGIGGSMAAGLMAAQEGAMVKRLHCGRAAQSGVYAASLASRGFTGISDIVEAGYGGFLSSYSREPDIGRLTAGLGATWETQRIGFKLYPAVTSIHAALDALKHVMATEGLTARDIAAVEVGCGHMTYVHTAWTYREAGVTAAQMNMFFGLAAVATGGDLTVGDFRPERMRDAGLLAFIDRITVHEDPELEAMGHRFRHACRMTVRTTEGRAFDHEILHRRGGPDAEVGWAEVTQKFRSITRDLLAPDDQDRICGTVSALDGVSDLGELCEIMAKPLPIA